MIPRNKANNTGSLIFDAIAAFEYFNNILLIVASESVNNSEGGGEGGGMSTSKIIETASTSLNVDKSNISFISLAASS